MADELIDMWSSAASRSCLPKLHENHINMSLRGVYNISSCINRSKASCADIKREEMLSSVKKRRATAPGADVIICGLKLLGQYRERSFTGVIQHEF